MAAVPGVLVAELVIATVPAGDDAVQTGSSDGKTPSWAPDVDDVAVMVRALPVPTIPVGMSTSVNTAGVAPDVSASIAAPRTVYPPEVRERGEVSAVEYAEKVTTLPAVPGNNPKSADPPAGTQTYVTTAAPLSPLASLLCVIWIWTSLPLPRADGDAVRANVQGILDSPRVPGSKDGCQL